jgi:flagellar motor switch protein FliG
MSPIKNFEDLSEATEDTLSYLLEAVKPITLAMALKGASPKTIDRILRILPKKARAYLEELSRTLGRVEVPTVEKAQEQVVELFRQA